MSVLAFLTSASLSLAATEFWVAPAPLGDDDNSGITPQQPWLTIQKARDHIRQEGANDGMTDDVIVNIKAGDYLVTSPITFGVEDSGGNGHHVIYRSVDGPGAARIRSGERLIGWEPDGAIWRRSFSSTSPVRVFYENGKAAVVARSPNLAEHPRYPGAHGGYRISEAGGGSGTVGWLQYYSGNYNPTDWTLTGQASVSWWFKSGSPDWGILSGTLTGINAATRRFTFATNSYQPGAGDRFQISGIRELLDAPGEYFHDVANNRLYYHSRFGSPNTQQVWLPRARRLLEIVGTQVGSQVHHIQFEGIAFSETIPHGGGIDYAWINPSAGVLLKHSNNIVIKNCLLEQLGTFGILMLEDNHHNRIEGCLIRHCGSSGIWIQNGLKRTAPYQTAKSEFHVVTNCKIHDYTENTVASYGGGVYLECVSDTTVSHCDISNAGRYALSLRGHVSSEWDGDNDPLTLVDSGRHFARGNVFEYIRATDTVTDSGDAGIVHAAHCNSPVAYGHGGNINTWRQLLISGGYNDPSSNDWAPDGIFVDHPNSAVDQIFENIHVAWVEGDQFRTNLNASQTTSNVSWLSGFDPALIDYANIGLTRDFPVEFDPQTTIIADDHTTDHTEVGANWVDTAIGQLHKGDGRYNATNNASQYAEWNAVLPRAGDYEVQVWKMASDANASTAAKYRVYHATGDTLYTLSQVSPSNQWDTLGRHTFRAGRTGRVRLTADGGERKAVRADAVRFIYLGAPGDDSARWLLDGNGNDNAGFGAANTLTLNSGLGYVSGGKFGSALSFDGVDDYATAADHDDLDIGTGDFAISGWFHRTSNTGGNLRLLSKGAGLDSLKGYAVWASDTLVKATLSNGSVRCYATVAYTGLNTWHHFAVNIDRASQQMTLYVDGVASSPVNINAAPTVDLGNSVPFNLGRNNNDAQYWPGRLDHIRIYKRLLAPEEIAALFDE